MTIPLIVWAGIGIAARIAAVAVRTAPVVVRTAPTVVRTVPRALPRVVPRVAPAARSVPRAAPKPRGNTAPRQHKGKRNKKKDDCAAAFKKYPVHEYKHRAQHCSSATHQSHHVQQNAQFMVGNKAIATICPGYTRGGAPCIPLKGKSTDLTKPHGIVTDMQRIDAANSRASGTPVTYGQASANARKQLKAAGLTPKEIKCVMAKVDAMLKKMCPGLKSGTVLRTPAR
jgi:hypothetical protein